MRLNTTGWTATSSGIGPGGAGIDGLLNSQAGPRTSGDPQHSGDFFQVDMGAPQRVTAVVLYSYNSPQRYSLTVSDDGANWGAPIATGEGGGNNMVIISFTPLTTRFLRVELTVDASGSWSVNEFSGFDLGVASPPSDGQVRTNFGTRSGEPNWNGTCDLNGDLRVDAIDLGIAARAAHP